MKLLNLFEINLRRKISSEDVVLEKVKKVGSMSRGYNKITKKEKNLK